MLADDHPAVRQGLQGLFELYPEFSVVAEAWAGLTAVSLFAFLRPDVALIDLRMPGQSGIATDQGLDHLPASGSLRHVRHSLKPHSLMADMVRSLLLDQAGWLWLGSRRWRLDAATCAWRQKWTWAANLLSLPSATTATASQRKICSKCLPLLYHQKRHARGCGAGLAPGGKG